MVAATSPLAESSDSPRRQDEAPKYPQYLPMYDPDESVEMVGPFEYNDPGFRADPKKPNLLSSGVKLQDLSPHCGSEIQGIQLTDLNPSALDELALLTAERGCVVLHNQTFTDAGFETQKRIASHFGPLHVHGWMPHPKDGPPEFVIVYDSLDDLRVRKSWARKNPIQFHVDQSPEKQPPGYTFFCMLEQPEGVGGDTIIASMTRAFSKLSPVFRKRLEGLWAVHSTGNAVARELRDNGDKSVMRRPVTTAVHPVVTVHPLTGEKALFVNSSYTRNIVGMDDDESDCLLKFLFDHINRGHDFSCRVRYAPGTVVIWDQRVTQHSQTLDYPAGQRRHAFRLTSLANIPVPSKVDEDDGECLMDEDRALLNLC